MILKQPNKDRVYLENIQWGDWDYDGSRLVIYNGSLFSGYIVYGKHIDGSIKNEVEYKNGSHLGWENEYNTNGQLIYSCLTVGETSLEIYKYDNNGSLIDHWKTVGDTYYQEMVNKYHLD